MDASPHLSRRKLVAVFTSVLAAAILPRASAAVKKRKAILVDDSHGCSPITNEYNFGSAELGRFLAAGGDTVEGTAAQKEFRAAKAVTLELLGRFDLFILNGQCGNHEIPFSDAEIADIGQWVQGGGGLLVVSAGTGFGNGKTSSIFNPVIAQFGLEFQDAHLAQTRRINKLKPGHAIVKGLREFFIVHGTPIPAKPPAEEIAWDGKDCVLASTRAGLGRVVALGGGSAFMGQTLNSQIMKNSPPMTVAANKALLSNLVNWLTAEIPGK